MGRRPRVHFCGAVYHVMARGVNGCPIYIDDNDRNEFLAILTRIENESGAEVAAYCLMGNHFHLAIKVGLVPLSSIMQRLLSAYSHLFNLRYQRTGHLFQARYKAILCTTDTYLYMIIRYIHQNPLRAGLVESAKEWPWSSVRQYPDSEALLADFNPWPNDEGPAPNLLRSMLESPNIESIGAKVALREGISVAHLRARSKSALIVAARRTMAREAVGAGHSMTDVAAWLGVASSSITRYCEKESENRKA